MAKPKKVAATTRQPIKYPHIWIMLVLVALTVAAFSPVLRAGFVSKYDDAEYVTGNRHVRAGLTPDGIVWAFTSREASNWHPVTWISHMVDISVFGIEKPWGHHLTNLLLHLASVLLLFLVLSRMTGAVWKSAFVAALFAIHPMHVESVAWIAERKDVLSTFFMMLTMLAYSHYAAKPNVGRYLPVFVFFALGLMCKPMLVTLPFVLMLLDLWPLGRFAPAVVKSKDAQLSPDTRALFIVAEKVPLLVLSLGSCIVTYWAQSSSGATSMTTTVPFLYRLANAMISYVEYIIKMFAPVRLATLYPHPGTGVSLALSAGAAMVLIAVTILAVLASRGRPYIGVGWFWYLGTLVPVIGLLQVGMQSMADRYSYVPYIGIFIVIAWGVPELLKPKLATAKRSVKASASPIVVPSALVIAVLSVVTFFQAQVWHDDEALFTHAVSVTKGNWFCYNNLGNALLDKGRTDDAIANYRLALMYNDNYPLANSNMGNALAIKGDFAGGLKYSLIAVAQSPTNADAQNNVGRCLGAVGRFAEAMPYFDRAIELNPDIVEAHNNRGLALFNLRRPAEAVADLRRAIELDPSFARAYPTLALALAASGDVTDAQAVVQQAQSRGIAFPADIARAINGK